MTDAEQLARKEVVDVTGKHMLCLDPNSRYFGWCFYKHPDGQWVTERMALPSEIDNGNSRLAQLEFERRFDEPQQS